MNLAKFVAIGSAVGELLAKPAAPAGGSGGGGNATIPDYLKTSSTDLQTIVKTSLRILITVVLIAAIVYLIINGIKFVTSQGDSNKAQEAQRGITYALIGIVVAIAASVLVNFVVQKLQPVEIEQL